MSSGGDFKGSKERCMGTELHNRIMAFNYGDDDRDALMRKVWEEFPWAVDAYTGSDDGSREREMLHWCYDQIGDQASPIRGRIGLWMRGSATVCGWTWFGFTLQRDH